VLNFRLWEFCFLTAVAFITQVGEKIILLKYPLLKRRQLHEIDLTLLKNDRSEHMSQIDLTEIDPWKARVYNTSLATTGLLQLCKVFTNRTCVSQYYTV